MSNSDLSRRLRMEASRLPNKFSVNDELFQLLTEAADALDECESLTSRLREAAQIAETTYDRSFSELFRRAAATIDSMSSMQHKAFLDGRKSAFLEILGNPDP